MRAPFVEPLDRTAILRHLETRTIAGVESVQAGAYRRTTTTAHGDGVVEIRFDRSQPELTLTAATPCTQLPPGAAGTVTRMFGLDEAVRNAESDLSTDPLIGSLVKRQSGLRVVGGWDPFEVAVRVVVAQQVSVSAAATMAARIAVRHGAALAQPIHGLSHLFPTADRLTELSSDGLGMPRSRSHTIAALARAFVGGDLDLDTSNFDDARAALMEIPGVGPWTVEVVLMRALRDPDAFPTGDLAIRRAVGHLLDEPPPSAASIAGLAEAWRPHRALAAQHLWASLHQPSGSQRQ